MRVYCVLFGLSLMGACASDYSLGQMCVADDAGFDIEGVSTLQDAAGYPANRDAVVLDFDDSQLLEDESWRVTKVELLAMVPDWVFDDYEGGDTLRVEIWDADRPDGQGHWSIDAPILPAMLDWEGVTLAQDAYWAGARNELQQQRAWMSFDFSEIIPESGMTSNRYTVGVGWSQNGLPTVGYSNFNLACSANFTDYGDGRWTLNSADGDGDVCSWPMMRVSVETRTLDDGSCEGTLEST
jgi:hypothetical protein